MVNGQQYLQITPRTSFATGTYTVDIWVNTYSCLSLNKGQITRSM